MHGSVAPDCRGFIDAPVGFLSFNFCDINEIVSQPERGETIFSDNSSRLHVADQT